MKNFTSEEKKYKKFPGTFIVFEGIDGSGKSLQAERLFSSLKENNANVTLVREPGGTVLAEEIRDILLTPREESLSAEAELFLYEAARAQLVSTKVIPLLRRGDTVICDRFTDSTLAYQGYGRSLELSFINKANRLASYSLTPDITIILDISWEESERRRNHKKKDRLEQEAELFFNRVRRGYIELAEVKQDVILLNGNASPGNLEQKILSLVKEKGRLS